MLRFFARLLAITAGALSSHSAQAYDPGDLSAHGTSEIRVHLIPDEWHLHHVGKLPDGRLIWIETQLSYDRTLRDTRDFLCIWIFSKEGVLTDQSKIIDLGWRSNPIGSRRLFIEQELEALGGLTVTDIWVRPFSVEKYGLIFGLLIRDEDDTDGDILIDAMPGMTLMFYPPWSEGGYDT